MKDRAKDIGEQIKRTSPFVIGGALLLVVAAFGIGFAAGGSDDSSNSNDFSKRGFHHQEGRGGPGGQQFGGPGRGRPFTQPDTKSLDKFKKCLKAEGVDLPTPGNPPSNSDRNKLRSAFQKCHPDVPVPGPGGQGGGPPGGFQGQGGQGQGGPPGGGPGQPPY